MALPMSTAIANTTSPEITEATSDANALTFAWSYNSKPDSFTAQYSCDGGVEWTTISMIPATERAWLIDTTVNAENCVVRIAARIDNVNGIFSDPVSPAPSSNLAPSNVVADQQTGKIFWDPSEAENIAQYEIEVSNDEGVTWTVVGKADGNITGFQMPELKLGAAFRITAITTDGQRITSDVQRVLDATAADVVRTASIPRSRVIIIGGVAIVLALIIGQWALLRRRRLQSEAGFEDFDALTRR